MCEMNPRNDVSNYADFVIHFLKYGEKGFKIRDFPIRNY